MKKSFLKLSMVFVCLGVTACFTACSGQPSPVATEWNGRSANLENASDDNETLAIARSQLSRCQVVKAIETLKPLVDRGNALAIYLTGSCYDWPSEIKNSQTAKRYYAKAIPRLQEAEKEGSVEATYYLGRYDWANGRKAEAQKRLKKSLAAFLLEADQNASLQSRLGDMYYFGLGSKVDKRKALGWYKKAAVNGNPHSQYLLGYIYLVGETVLKDRKRALSYLEQSSEYGYGPAMQELGWQLFHSSLAKERRRGMELVEKASAQKTKNSSKLLADMKKKMRNVPRTQAEVKSFVKKVSRVVGKQIMESIGGGQDLVVKVQSADYDAILGEYEIDIVVSFNGIVFRSDNYQAAGRITVREDGTNPRFARTATNELFREWAGRLDGLKLVNEILDEFNKANR